MLKRSDINLLPPFYDAYINQVEDIGIVNALKLYEKVGSESDITKLMEIGDQVYASGKWTVKQIIQHLIDVERVFAYRAMRIARGDKTPLPGFSEGDYALNADVSQKSLQTLVNEFELIRKSTILLFSDFTDNVLQNVGNCSKVDISVLALGFAIVGHQKHHVAVIRERYFSLTKV